VRGEARPDSDLDVFIDVEPDRRFSLIDLPKIQHFLEDELGTSVDLTTRDSLHPLLCSDIEREAGRVFWWRAASMSCCVRSWRPSTAPSPP
jgi:uncharacterized protein